MRPELMFVASGGEQGLQGSNVPVGNGSNVETADCRRPAGWPERPRQRSSRTGQDVQRPVRAEDERLRGIIEDFPHPFVYGSVSVHGPFGIGEGDVLGIGATHGLSPPGPIALAEYLGQVGVYQSSEAIRVVHLLIVRSVYSAGDFHRDRSRFVAARLESHGTAGE